ncbi:MAG: hypothetical protein HFE67_04325 [Erysipelotrichaceae bacterium]|nr:hypothetical protein [Erysipelotrichaceae bacterium]
MKKKVIAALGIVILAIALGFALRPKSFDRQFHKVMDNLDSYILKGDMEITKGEDIKSYAVEVGYQKMDEVEMFKVSLLDKALNQEQIILRNEQGVFVVTPALNQIFKFEGDWPLNSPKPYLLQSMVQFVDDENAEIEKQEDGYVITTPVVYPNNKSYAKQKMLFDKDANIQWVEIYNQDENAELRIQFHTVDYNKEIAADYFAAPTSMEKPTSTTMVSEADLPLYPSAVFDAQLSGKSVMNNNGVTKHILEFSGAKNFTVVENIRTGSDTTQTVIMPGQMMDVLDVVGFYDGNRLSAMANGIEYTVFSDDLDPEEMMSVINSMQVAVMK